MSAETQAAALICPKCGRRLVADGLQPAALVLCAGCRAVFDRIDPAARRTSRKAVASLVLGCASLIGMFFTGIPAVLLGIGALRSIRRQPDTLKGAPLAIGGIATGTVFGLMCGTCMAVSLGMGLMGRYSMTQTSDPQQVASIADEIGPCRIPEGLKPLGGMTLAMVDMRMAVYGSEPRAASPLIVMSQQMPGSLPSQVEQQAMQAVNMHHQRGGDSTVERTEPLTCQIRGQSVTVRKSTEIHQWSGVRYREYVAAIPDPDHATVVILVTPDEAGVEMPIGPPPPQASPHSPPIAPRPTQTTKSLTEAEVRAFFESFE
jgi:hypothetical protein